MNQIQKIMIEDINGRKGRCLWKVKPIVDKIVEYKKMFQEVKFCLWNVRRIRLLIGLQKQAIKGMCSLGWVFQPPFSFVYVLNNDGFPTPPLV